MDSHNNNRQNEHNNRRRGGKKSHQNKRNDLHRHKPTENRSREADTKQQELTLHQMEDHQEGAGLLQQEAAAPISSGPVIVEETKSTKQDIFVDINPTIASDSSSVVVVEPTTIIDKTETSQQITPIDQQENQEPAQETVPGPSSTSIDMFNQEAPTTTIIPTNQSPINQQDPSTTLNPNNTITIDEPLQSEAPVSMAVNDNYTSVATTSENSLERISNLTKLNTASGSEVYLVGTAHFSHKSVQDVQNVIRTIKPHAVILELCQERAFMLNLDEESLLEQNRKLSFDKIRSAIVEKGLAQGLIYIMFVKMSANLTEKLGMAPGSEFRAGSNEALKIPGCGIILGDRSLKVTIARAVASLSLWQKIKLVYQVLLSDVSITQEDVEKCKDKDILEQMLQELGGEFPGFKQVLLDERNIFLAHSIYTWSENSVTSRGPAKIVGIVGCGHVKGIVEHWGNTTDEDCKKIMEVPKRSRTSRVISKTIKYCSLALILYASYRLVVPTSVQTAIYEKISFH